jgi:hypothetical protein
MTLEADHSSLPHRLLKWVAVSPLVVILAVTASAAPGQEPSPEHSLFGRLLLPAGSGSRGVEVIVETVARGNEPRRTWLLFDEQGNFTHDFEGKLTRLVVAAGIGREVYRLDADEVPEADQGRRIDVGVIDLREQLVKHRLLLRAAEGRPEGVVRIGMFLGPPPRGPRGETVSLGSRQFPPVTLASELEWLLPHDAESIYFLVERPDGSGRGIHWRSGRQRLFGPFTSADFPSELAMD